MKVKELIELLVADGWFQVRMKEVTANSIIGRRRAL